MTIANPQNRVRAVAVLGAALAALAAAFVLPPAASAQGSTERALRYVAGAQNADGGFGAGVHTRSTQLYTGWAALGIASTGVNPLRVRRGRRSPIHYMARGVRGLTETGEISRTTLAVRASGLSARRFAGVDLARRLARRQRSSGGRGSWSGLTNQTAFAILALRAAGAPSRAPNVRLGARWLRSQQRPDGGFGLTRRSGSDVDITASVVQALVAAGQRRSRATFRAMLYLHRAQNRDGGWGQRRGQASNAQSTAFAIQAVSATRLSMRHFTRSRTPLGFLRSLQTGRGSIRYSRRSAQTPVWVTSQALLGLTRSPFPLRR